MHCAVRVAGGPVSVRLSVTLASTALKGLNHVVKWSILDGTMVFLTSLQLSPEVLTNHKQATSVYQKTLT